MLRAIEFMDKRFKKEDDYNLFAPLSNNTIVLCNNYKLLDSLAKEIINTVNGDAEYNDYDCDDEDVGKAKICLAFGLQRIIAINKQKITLSLEPAIIYKANNLEDIWLFSYRGTDEIKTLTPYEEYIYPAFIFKGSREVWKSGKDELYETIVNGMYGTYDEGWINTLIDINNNHSSVLL